jgi:hypothetical protein
MGAAMLACLMMVPWRDSPFDNPVDPEFKQGHERLGSVHPAVSRITSCPDTTRAQFCPDSMKLVASDL